MAEPAEAHSSMCDICQLFASKYKCPRCMKRTCSAACVKVHKDAEACSGTRDVTGFVRLREFDDNQLMDDYQFLSSTKKALENERIHASVKPASPAQRRPKRGRDEVNADQPPKWQALARHCRETGQTIVHLMPKSLSRRKLNRSHLKQGAVYWTVEVVKSNGERMLLHRVPESETLIALLGRMNADVSSAAVVMPVYGRPANEPLFFRFDDREATLAQMLRGKEVLEFPTLLLKDSIDEKLVVNSTEGASLRAGFVVPKLIVAELEEKEKEQEALVAAIEEIDDDEDYGEDDNVIPAKLF